jgi:hypothetical protein
MNKTTKISLDIDTDKLPAFYISLALHKINKRGDTEALKTIADAIHFDFNALSKKLKPDEGKQRRHERSFLEIHAFLYNSKKDSPGYLEVSKENLEEFKASAFGKELKNKFYLLELSRQWTGKADSTEVQVFIAMYMFSGYILVDALNKAFSTPDMKEKPLEIVHKQNANPERLNIETNGQAEPGEEVEAEFYIEKEGHIIKVAEEDIEENTEHIFIKTGDEVVRVKKQANESEYTPYHNVKVMGDRLDFSYATAGEPYTVPIEPVIIKKAAKEITIDLHKVKIDKQQYENLVEELKKFLRLPKGARGQTEVRDELIIDLYNSLTKHYPDLTIHVYTTITGYIASRMGLLETLELYDETERKQPYRKYLRDTVYNILKSRRLVNK